jgi:hypothetical protein
MGLMCQLLHHPVLNRAEFFGSLRMPALRCLGALALSALQNG